jgi:hypothetical protein
MQIKPCRQLFLFGLPLGDDLLALRRRPECVQLGGPLVPAPAAGVGRLAAGAVEAVIVKIALGKSGMALAPTPVAGRDVVPDRKRIESDRRVRLGEVVRKVGEIPGSPFGAMALGLRSELLAGAGRELDHMQFGFAVRRHNEDDVACIADQVANDFGAVARRPAARSNRMSAVDAGRFHFRAMADDAATRRRPGRGGGPCVPRG